MHAVLVKFERNYEWHLAKKGEKATKYGSIKFDPNVPWNHPRSAHRARHKILMMLEHEGMKSYEEEIR